MERIKPKSRYMEKIPEQRFFFKREQRNNSADDMRGNVVRPVENRTSRTKCGPLGHDKH